MKDVTVTIEEHQRQLILLALAHLAVNRPGWNEAIAEIALKMDNPDGKGSTVLFETLKEHYIHPIPDHPTDETLKRALEFK